MCQHKILITIVTGTVLAVSIIPRDVHAALAHRYSFDGNVNDSVGTANGAIIDPGAVTAAFAGGQLDLSANTGEPSNAIGEDAYVDLPNGMITGIATGGTSGALSVELWATVSETHTWQRYVDFGTSNDGEDTSNGGGASGYVYISPNSGRWTDGLATETHEPNGPADEVGQTGPFPNGVQVHVVGTYDHNDLSAGPNGTLKLYRDGALIGETGIADLLDLRTFADNNNWIGRSQWPDPVFDGLFNELRMYNHALSASEVATNSIFGPDVADPGDVLSLTVNTTTGAVTMSSQAPIAVDLDFYRISSAASALSVAGWNSLDSQNYDAIDGPDAGTTAGDSPGEGWDQAGGAGASQLIEYFLGESGSSIDPGEMLSLGSAFDTSVFGGGNDGDVEFTFGLVGGLEISGSVTYVSGPGFIAGDFAGDGAVEGADLSLLLGNWGADVATVPATWDGDPPTAPFVDGDDLSRLLGNWGNTAGAGTSVTAVPEPATGLAALLGAVAVVVIGGRGWTHSRWHIVLNDA